MAAAAIENFIVFCFVTEMVDSENCEKNKDSARMLEKRKMTRGEKLQRGSSHGFPCPSFPTCSRLLQLAINHVIFPKCSMTGVDIVKRRLWDA